MFDCTQINTRGCYQAKYGRYWRIILPFLKNYIPHICLNSISYDHNRYQNHIFMDCVIIPKLIPINIDVNFMNDFVIMTKNVKHDKNYYFFTCSTLPKIDSMYFQSRLNLTIDDKYVPDSAQKVMEISTEKNVVIVSHIERVTKYFLKYP